MGAISSLRKSEICLEELAPKLALDKSVTNRRLGDATNATTLSILKPVEASWRRIFPAIQCRKP